MSAEVIREFLVSLGYKVDVSGEQKFVAGIKNVSKEVLALGAAAIAGAATVTAYVAKIADGLEGLYFASQRTRASAENIQSLEFAAENLGSSSDAALGSIESLAKFLRINPGGESLIKSWGIQTRDTNGELRDTTELLNDLGKLFRRMPYAQAYARANVLGIDEKTLQALIKGTDQFSDRYKQILARYGLDVTKATELSHQFNIGLRDLKANFEVLGTVVGTRIIGVLDELEYRWDSLDASTKDNIKTTGEWIAGLVAGAAVILGGPVVWIGSLASAIALLWDDYKVWKESGKSLIDWSRWKPEIDFAKAGLRLVGDEFRTLFSIAKSSWPYVVEGWHALTAAVKDAYEWIMKVIHAVENSKPIQWAIEKTQGARDAVSSVYSKAASWLSGKLDVGLKTDIKHDLSDYRDAAGQIWNQLTGKPYDRGVQGSPAVDEGSPPSSPPQSPPQSPFQSPFQSPSASTELPLGIRQNNPGNLRTGPGGSFGSYATPEDGLKALSNQLSLYFTGRSAAANHQKLQTVREIVSVYAPPKENNTAAYIADVAGRLGVNPDAQINLDDVATKAKLMQAITLHEQGRNPYSDAQYQQAAGANLSAQTTINVYGSTNPQETAATVGREQDTVNQRLVRNFQTAAAM